MKYNTLIIIILLTSTVLQAQSRNDLQQPLKDPSLFVLGVIEMEEPIYISLKDEEIANDIAFITEKKNLDFITKKEGEFKYFIFDPLCYEIFISQSLVRDYVIPNAPAELIPILEKSYPNEYSNEYFNTDAIYGYEKETYYYELSYIDIYVNRFVVILIRLTLAIEYTPVGVRLPHLFNEPAEEGIYLKILIPILDE